ncbi:MAG TPA: HAD family hydrolase [Oculatellaceae cyanobacterium]|jgi:putative hydrolase of the HAD superfamily
MLTEISKLIDLTSASAATITTPVEMQLPKVIFLDAVGTLFGVRGSVGEVYRELALRFGVDAPADVLNKAFFDSFKAAAPPFFLGVESADIPNCEFEWWRDIALHTFQKAEVLDQFSNFTEFFQELYAHFATAEPWFIYPDVIAALEHWQKMSVEMGVLSNFDSRLYKVLQALKLEHFFTSVTISSQVGAAKPNEKIFLTALEKHQCNSQSAWHIGDSLKEDYQGAIALGIKGILLKRDQPVFPA